MLFSTKNNNNKNEPKSTSEKMQALNKRKSRKNEEMICVPRIEIQSKLEQCLKYVGVSGE